ncbi:MAG: hypothetical protein HY553_21010 [Elusimicrobia bacterium]|nr:hypothetical protein [Elusimicrobiota bacterium]
MRVPGRGRSTRICTVAQARRRLGRSRRQVYRLVASGVLPSAGKAFGELLLEADAVERLAGAPRSPQPIPAGLAPLFPEYELSRLNVGRDRSLVVTRVLDRGTSAEIRWLLRRLSRGQIARCIREDGARLLSPRSLKLWSLCFRVTPKPLPAWRGAPNPWLDARS